MYKAVSLFSNAGIGDIGVENAGVRVLFANELLEKRANTYALNHKETEVLTGDINALKDEDYQKMKDSIDDELFLLVATPPCQGVSTAGRRHLYDMRNQLIKPTVNAIKKLRPLWVWMENVPTYDAITIPDTPDFIEDGPEHERITVLDFLKKQLEPEGYKIELRLLDAKDYGVPQTRKRLIFILTRTDKEISFPEATHGVGAELEPFVTVRDAIGHLESLESGEKSTDDPYHIALKHNDKHVKWLMATPEGQSAFDNPNFEDKPHVLDKETGELRLIKGFKNTYKRIFWDQPAPTVTMASGVISSQENVHPSDSRALTVREVMTIQSMPESFVFPEKTSNKEMRDMIGEAVPPKLAEAITRHIIQIHEEK